MDYRKLVNRADLVLDGPVLRSDDGLPIGNGVMGTCIWTTPAALKFQINRVDVYGNGSESRSFFIRHRDYGYACALLDVECAGADGDVFTKDGVQQHLHLYDADAEVRGAGVETHSYCYADRDVMAVSVDDTRAQPAALSAVLRMMRPPVVEHFSHRAESEFTIDRSTVILTQRFSEGSYYCASAVAMRWVGEEVRIRERGDGEVALSVSPKAGLRRLFVATAASFDPDEDLAQRVSDLLEKTESEGAALVREKTKEWWHEYWSRSHVSLHSTDGLADKIEAYHTYFQYIMACCSRGQYAPNFGGLLFSTRGDIRDWGVMQWGNNISCYYRGLSSSNRPETMEPFFRHYLNMYDSLAKAADQQFGAGGIYLPETVWFDGLEVLPDDIASELRELMLARKSWSERSDALVEYAASKHPHNSRWNWKGPGNWENGRWTYPERPTSPFGPVTHMFRGATRTAWIAWEFYEHTHDLVWLRDVGYPLIKGITDFFCTYPNLITDETGTYHIHHVNNSEGYFGCRDGAGSMVGLRSLPQIAIRLAETLEVDTDRREVWREIADNMAPLATNDDPREVVGTSPTDRRVWVGGLKPCLVDEDRSAVVDANNYYMDLCTLETRENDPDLFTLGENTFLEAYELVHGDNDRVSALSRMPLKAALLGHTDKVRELLPAQMFRPAYDFCYTQRSFSSNGEILANRLTVREGQGATGAQRLGNASAALYLALVQSVPSSPAGPLTLRLFPSWPTEWDAEFCLLCRGGYVVSCAMTGGEIGPVTIEIRHGGSCRVRNPWPGETVALNVDGHSRSFERAGDLLTFDAAEGETLVLERSK
jgi:alpha-L-fucosidase 2